MLETTLPGSNDGEIQIHTQTVESILLTTMLFCESYLLLTRTSTSISQFKKQNNTHFHHSICLKKKKKIKLYVKIQDSILHAPTWTWIDFPMSNENTHYDKRFNSPQFYIRNSHHIYYTLSTTILPSLLLWWFQTYL